VDQKPNISFCIITNGERPSETNLCIKSIHRNFTSFSDYEILVIGNNVGQFSSPHVKVIEDNIYVKYLGKRRNIGTENSFGDVIVHCDDDMIFPPNWYQNFKDYDRKNKDWQILGNKVLIPCGNRYYDRCTYTPTHQMVDYDFDDSAPGTLLYQSGAFSICKRSLLENICWNNEIPFYGKLNGFDCNEDVDFSRRLKEAGIKISFDEKNTVWHNDYSYYYKNNFAYKKSEEDISDYKCLDFVTLLNFLTR